MNKSRKQYIECCELSELCTLNIGGYSQKVLIEGKDFLAVTKNGYAKNKKL